MRVLAQEKLVYLNSRIEITRKSFQGLKKIDGESLVVNESILQVYPHIPKKMVNSISFGDGKIRKRHHSRNKDTIKIGEISLNEDILMDEELPMNKRYKKFSPKNVIKM